MWQTGFLSGWPICQRNHYHTKPQTGFEACQNCVLFWGYSCLVLTSLLFDSPPLPGTHASEAMFTCFSALYNGYFPSTSHSCVDFQSFPSLSIFRMKSIFLLLNLPSAWFIGSLESTTLPRSPSGLVIS